MSRDGQARARLESRLLFSFFVVQILALTLLQKIGFGASSEDVIPVALPIMFVGLGALCLFVRPNVSPVRAALYFAFVIASALSTVLFADAYSVNSLALYAALYLPMTLAFSTDEATYRKCLNFYCNVMLAAALIAIGQHLIQIVHTWRDWPDLNKLLPANFLIPNYVYIQPILWGLPYMKPNGIFFLEVSFLSQFLALALAVEVAIFRRTWRVVFLSAVLLATFAGTGLLLLLLTLPVLMGRMKLKPMTLTILAVTLVAWLAFNLGWFDLVQHRLNEFHQAGRSANMRFIEPLNRLIDMISQPGWLYSGIGAGQIEKAENFQWWPITKAAIEYGLLPALLFYAFFLFSLFENAFDRRLAFTLAVWFSIEGALLTAVNPLTCAVLSTLFVPRRRSQSQDVAIAHSRKATRADLLPEIIPQRRVENEDAAASVGRPGTDGRLIYAIGDIHGRADLLASLVRMIRADIANSSPPQERPLLIFLGDYVDRGPNSREVIDQVIALREDASLEVRCLLGNHEEGMLDFLDRRTTGASWNSYGGRNTLLSYGVQPPEDEDDKSQWSGARSALARTLPPEHEQFLRDLELVVIVGDLLFVHAGLRPGVPLGEQKKKDLLYIRREFLDAEVDCGKVVIHGHTPRDRAYGAPGRLCLDSGAYVSGLLTAARFEHHEYPRLIEARANTG